MAQPAVPGEGEWTDLHLAYPALRAVRRLLPHAEVVEVLEPAEARAELAAAVRALSALYLGDESDTGAQTDQSRKMP